MQRISNLECAIFDLDGTLLDSMHVWYYVDVEFLKRRNIPYDAEFPKHIVSMTFEETANFAIKYFNLKDTTPRELMKEWEDLAIDLYTYNVKLKSGAKEFLLYLKENGIKLGIATALSKSMYEPCLKNNGVFDLFDKIISLDDCKKGKNSPEIYINVANEIGVSPQHTVVFEDIYLGLMSAKEAGFQVVGVIDESSKYHENDIKKIASFCITDYFDIKF